MRKINDLTGKRFDSLKVLGMAPTRNKFGHVQWDCLCDCGKTATVCGNHLTAGTTTSCGCVAIQVRRGTAQRRNRDAMGGFNREY